MMRLVGLPSVDRVPRGAPEILRQVGATPRRGDYTHGAGRFNSVSRNILISGEATQTDATRLAGRTVAVLALGRKPNRLCIAGSRPRG